MLGGQLSSASPEKLQGKLQGAPREFFWDSITRYVAGVIIALAAINSIFEFVRGSRLKCLSSSIPSNFTDTDFIDIYCASSVPKGAYFSGFITVHAIIILIPNALWTNIYSGNFDYFFVLSRMIERTRDCETGEYPLKNYTIARQLQRVFTNYKENWMFISYVLMLLTQLMLTLLGFLIVVFYFKDFKGTFLCPSYLRMNSKEPTDWPLNKQVICVMKPLTFYSMIRFADLILLTILILSYIWSLAWCTSTHSLILGWNKVADFTFQTSIPPRYYRYDVSPLRRWSSCLKLPLQGILRLVPFVGTGPHIRTNLDFLLLKLFRTDSGLGIMMRRMLILSRVNYLSDNDNRIVKLHRIQQEHVDFNSGDITSIDGCELGFNEDIKWKFPKEAGQTGLYDSPSGPIDRNDTLVLPDSLRGIVLGFASLSTSRDTAMFITFGSPSLGIPCALARVFKKVIVLNFNPHYNLKAAGEDQFYHSSKYLSKIQVISYPEDILSSTCDKFEDWKESVKELEYIDFIVVGPIHRKFNITTVSLCLTELAGKHFKQTSLLTILPVKIGGKDTRLEFFCYCPPDKYFKERNQRIRIRSNQDLSFWPPTPIDSDKEGSTMLNHFTSKVIAGNTECRFVFKFYEHATNSSMKREKDESTSGADRTASTSAEGSEIVLATEMEGTPLLSGPTKLYS